MDIQKRLLIEKKDVSLHYQNNKTNDNVKTQKKIYTIELDVKVIFSYIILTYKKKARFVLQAGNKSVTKMAFIVPSVAGFQGAKIQLFWQMQTLFLRGAAVLPWGYPSIPCCIGVSSPPYHPPYRFARYYCQQNFLPVLSLRFHKCRLWRVLHPRCRLPIDTKKAPYRGCSFLFFTIFNDISVLFLVCIVLILV